MDIKAIIAKHTDQDGKLNSEAFTAELNSEIPKEFVSKEQYNIKAEEVKTLTADLSAVKDSSAANADLKKELNEKLKQATERAEKAEADAAMLDMKNAASLLLRDEGAKYPDLLLGQIDFTKVVKDGENFVNLKEQVAGMKETYADNFKTDESPNPTPPKITVGGNPNPAPKAGVDKEQFFKMTSWEQADFAAKNPEQFKALTGGTN